MTFPVLASHNMNNNRSITSACTLIPFQTLYNFSFFTDPDSASATVLNKLGTLVEEESLSPWARNGSVLHEIGEQLISLSEAIKGASLFQKSLSLYYQRVEELIIAPAQYEISLQTSSFLFRAFKLGYRLENLIPLLSEIQNINSYSSILFSLQNMIFIKDHPDNKISTQILLRYNQLVQLPFEDTQLDMMKSLQLAFFIEIRLSNTSHLQSTYVKKTVENLSRSIFRGQTTGDFFIFSKHKVKKYIEYGESKKVSSVIHLFQDVKVKPKIAIQTVNLDNRIIYSSEIAIQHFLNGKPGIWPFYNFFEYEKHSHSHSNQENCNPIQKMSFISPLGKRLPVLGEMAPCFAKQRHIAKSLLQGLQSMHQSGIVHVDLKPQNALIGPNSEVGLIDFGHSFWPGRGELPGSHLSKGYYGTIPYTAPELLGIQNFKGDYYKLDIWALGILLYEMRFQKEFLMCNLACSHYEQKEGNQLTKKIHNSITKSTVSFIQNVIEQPFQMLLDQTALNFEEHYELFIYSCLRLDPNDRFDSCTAFNFLEYVEDIHSLNNNNNNAN